jgi:ABC-type nitrate/sulfonate/bicarbonate transport system substrate-binding protein
MKILLLASLLPALANAAPLEKITMQLDWKPNAQFAGLLVAKEKGYYEKAGLDVTILSVDGAMDTVGRVVKGGAWIGCAESHVLLAARAKGAPIKAFGTMIQASPFALLSLKKTGIHSVKEFKGRVLGLHADGDKAIDVVLGTNGLKRSDVKIKEVPFGLDSLLNGSCEIMQGYLVDEVVECEIRGIPINVIPMSEHGYTAYGQVYFTNETFLNSKPDTVRRFFEASNAGWNEAVKHPHATAKLIVEKYLPSESVKNQEASLRALTPVLTAESPRMGWMKMKTWEVAAHMFAKYRMLDRYVPPAELVTEQFLKD